MKCNEKRPEVTQSNAKGISMKKKFVRFLRGRWMLIQ